MSPRRSIPLTHVEARRIMASKYIKAIYGPTDQRPWPGEYVEFTNGTAIDQDSSEMGQGHPWLTRIREHTHINTN